VAKRGLPTGISMRHDSHYVEELARVNRSIGKILPIDKIEPNPDQPRVEIGDLTELTSSIKEKGVLEPLLVKPNKEHGTWMIIAGERRWRASNLAGLKEVPCIELDLDEQSIAEIALIENLQRKDLTIWEEADGLAALATKFGYTHDQIAKKIGKSRTTITESMSIAGIPENIRHKCREANVSAKSILLEVARQFDDGAMLEFVEKITSKGLKRQEIRQELRPAVNKVNPGKLGLSKEKTPPPEQTVFKYAAFDDSFDIEIIFNRPSFEKKDVLRALKEAFDSIKNG
jgi:ParB family chromosome partitioning protein